MRTRLTVVFVSLILVGALGADADASVDWSNVTWTAGSLTNSYYVGDTLVTFTWTDTGGVIVSGNPFIQSNASGFDDVLQCRMDISATPEPPTQYITLTVTFSKPVKQVEFTLADIDGGGVPNASGLIPNWQDVVIVSGYLDTTEKTVTASSTGSAVSIDTNGNDYSTSKNLSLYATTGNVPTTGTGNTAGNVPVVITDWINKFTVDYYPGRSTTDVTADGFPLTGPTNAGSQFIRMHNVKFVPEPGGLALFSVGLVLAGVWQRRRSRRRKLKA